MCIFDMIRLVCTWPCYMRRVLRVVPNSLVCEKHTANRELTGTFRRRGQTNCETLTLKFFVDAQSVSCVVTTVFGTGGKKPVNAP